MVGLALRLKPSRREGSWSIGATAYGRLRCLYFKGVNAGVEWAKSFRMLVTIWGTPVGDRKSGVSKGNSGSGTDCWGIREFRTGECGHLCPRVKGWREGLEAGKA